MQPMDQPVVVAGEIIIYRLYDIAYAVDLDRAEAILAQRTSTGASRKRLSATPPKAVAYDAPPVVMSLDPVPLSINGSALDANVTGRLYDFGVVSLALDVPVRNLQWTAFQDLLDGLAASIGAGSGEHIWTQLAGQVREQIADALVRPAVSMLEEDYIVALVRSFGRAMTAAEIQEKLDLVPLLSGERSALSESAQQDLLRNRFSYYTDDLVVITWDRAFVYEPRRNSDVIDVLEVANAQLLEMRYYDELLDAELPRMYDLVQKTRRASGLFSSRRFARLARNLYTLVAEVTELTEKVDNALQVTEDVYLARIYAATLDLFRVHLVSIAVERKLAIIRDTYTALYDEASGGRATLLEIAIVVLIVVEILIALWGH
ncbi:MAG: hypothetical protein JO110_03045 [Acetobacteraceae bacterium]|nr:hypothetical protein [Acetobacteraceae bacterium]